MFLWGIDLSEANSSRSMVMVDEADGIAIQYPDDTTFEGCSITIQPEKR